VLSPPIVTDLGLELGAIEGGPGGGNVVQSNTLQRMETVDGALAESIAELIDHAAALAPGEVDRRLGLDDSRWLRVDGGRRVEVKAITWHERIEAHPHVLQTEIKGNPKS
jgi:hypothetical protein